MRTAVAYAMMRSSRTPGSAKSYRMLRRNTISLRSAAIERASEELRTTILPFCGSIPGTSYFDAFRRLAMRVSTANRPAPKIRIMREANRNVYASAT